MGGIQKMAVTLAENVRGTAGVGVLDRAGDYAVTGKIKFFELDVVTRSGFIVHLRRVFRLARLLREVEPGIVVGLGYSVGVYAVLASILARSRAKIVIGVRNSLKEIGAKRRWLRVCLPMALARADLIIPISVGLKSELLIHGMGHEDNIVPIYNGVNVERIKELSYERADHPWAQDCEALVVTVGRLSTQKNIQLLLRAISVVRRQLPIKCLVIGDGECFYKLKELASILELDGIVDFIGRKDNPYPYMRRARVFVLSSSFEGFGNVLVEAMACDTPVISTDCPSGPAEIIGDNEYGFLVDVYDVDAMADAIRRLCEDDDCYTKMRGRAKERANEFSLEKMIARYENALNSVIVAKE